MTRSAILVGLVIISSGGARATPWGTHSGPGLPGPECSVDTLSVVGDRRDGEAIRSIAQRLMAAIAPGDTAVWSRYLDDQVLFSDEEANVYGKPALLAEFKPLPPGFSGHICVTDPRAIVRGNVAVLTFDAMETETVYGQVLHTRYHTTDMFVRSDREWRLLGSHTSVLPSEHTPGVGAPQSYGDYVGRYALAPGVVEYTIAREGEHLFGQRTGRQREELLPLGGDRFYRTGARRGERIFRRDATGRVDAMVDRRDNNDLVWSRVR